MGDHLNVSHLWADRKAAWISFTDRMMHANASCQLLAPGQGLGLGNSHMLMMDHDGEDVLLACLQAASVSTPSTMEADGAVIDR